ncbi:MAG: hypothetical protein AB1679_17360 [Actinomycetota bacterium]|jgi:hypothetical protein
MRRHQLFAAAVSAALLFGAASPAMAKPGKGQAKGHSKPAKVKAGRINGGGVSFGGAEFSVQARARQPRKGHFHYTRTDGSLKVRCKGVEFTPIAYIQPGPPGAVVTDSCVEMVGSRRTPISVEATFFDHGRTGDVANITFTRPDGTTVTDNGVIREGNVHVR